MAVAMTVAISPIGFVDIPPLDAGYNATAPQKLSCPGIHHSDFGTHRDIGVDHGKQLVKIRDGAKRRPHRH